MFFNRRLLLMFLSWSAFLAATRGAREAVQFGFGLANFGGLESMTHVTLAAVREGGPSVSTFAAFLALVVWFDGSEGRRTRAQLLRPGLFLLLVAALGLALVTGLVIIADLCAARAFGASGQVIALGSNALARQQFLVAPPLFAAYALATAALGWLTLPSLARSGWHWLAKASLVWGVSLLLVAALAVLGLALGELPAPD